LAPPTQIQFETFGTWLATVAKRGDLPFKRATFEQYMRHMVSVFEKDFPAPLVNVAASAQTKRFVKAVARQLDSTKQRARPVQFADLSLLAVSAPAVLPAVLAKVVTLVALVAFWGCLRLGTLVQDLASGLEVVSWRDVFCDGQSLFICIFRDKTIDTRDDGHRIVLKAVPSKPWLCPVRAFMDYASICTGTGLSLDDPLARFCPTEVLTADSFLLCINRLLPGIPPLPSRKGHFTRHSFRRGHAQAAIACGIPLEDLMLFGNWRSLPAVRNYTAEAVKASSLVDIFERVALSQFGI
jgi:hypothetical protein